jgi:hypothetical protein
MSLFYQRIAEKIAVSYRRLSIVRNPDGFLQDEAVRRSVTAATGIIFISGSPLELRLHFELHFKSSPETRFCYLCDTPDEILPDIIAEAWVTTFYVADIFPNYQNRALLSQEPADILERLYDQPTAGFISATETALRLQILKTAPVVAKKRVDDPVAALHAYSPDWASFAATTADISNIVLAAIEQDKYTAIEPELRRINDTFQSFLDASYTGALVSSPVLSPRSVNRILPHLAHKHGAGEKVALIVVDGMAYWQYLVLKDALTLHAIPTADSAILAYLPSITMLSRQAIFRGDFPDLDYKQNPANEEKLWRTFWTGHGITDADIQYIYGENELEIYGTTRRLALVSVTPDEVMHAVSDPCLLHAFTSAWAEKFTGAIQKILDAGFTVYITTDHGNIPSHGTGTLTPQEKTHLFKDSSRGQRHLLYSDHALMESFLQSHDAADYFAHGDNLSIRSDGAFARPGKDMITHGGAHFLEVAIPFITVNQ